MRTLFLVAIALFAQMTTAQNTEKRLEKIKALRVAFISNKLQLTPQEAEKFWPIFNQIDAERSQLLQAKRKLNKQSKLADLSEKTGNELLNNQYELDENIIALNKKMHKSLQGVLSSQKIILLQESEKEFRATLLRQLKNRKQKQGN